MNNPSPIRFLYHTRKKISYFGGVKFTFGGVGGAFFGGKLNFQSKSKSASLCGSGKVIGFVQNHLDDPQNLVLYLCSKPGT